MEIVEITKCIENGEYHCGWELFYAYTYKPNARKNRDTYNVKDFLLASIDMQLQQYFTNI